MARDSAGAENGRSQDNPHMVEETRVEVQKYVADYLGVELGDLVLVANTDSSYTFRSKSTDQEHVAEVEVGPEGPVVHVSG